MPLLSPTIAETTKLTKNCFVERLRSCQQMYQTVTTLCEKQWNGIADDILTIYAYVQFFLLQANCQIDGVDFAKMRQMLQYKNFNFF